MQPIKKPRTDKISVALPLLVSVSLALCSAACHHGGVLRYEDETRLAYYLSDAPLLHKLYDSGYLDDGKYQARELSYLFNYLDCEFMALCTNFGHPHFLSVVQYIFLLLTSLVFWQFGVGELKLSRWIVLGALLLFWTTPAVFLSGNFSQTAKYGAAFALVVLYTLVFHFLRAGSLSRSEGMACFGWGLMAALFDGQGIFLIAVVIALLIFWYLGYWTETALKLAAALVAVIAVSFLYNHFVGPWATLSNNYYWPDFGYENLSWANLRAKPAYFLGAGLSLYLDTVRFLLGNIPRWLAAVVVLALAGWALARRRSRPLLPVTGIVLSQTVFIWILIVLMVLRTSSLTWPDVRRGAELLPLVAAFVMTLLLTISEINVPKTLLALLLGAALAGNLAALPRQRALADAGRIGPIQSSVALRRALRNFRDPRFPVSAEISQNPVFQFFENGYFAKKPVLPPRARKPLAARN